MPDVLKINESVPDFSLPSDNGGNISLSQFRDRQAVLVFFYPADFTPVCTGEVCAFRDDYEAFRARNVALIGISGDSVERHRNFSKQCSLPFPLLSDEHYVVARAFGAKGLLGMRRAYYLISSKGNLLWQHAECLPVFRLCNARIIDVVQQFLPSVTPLPTTANPRDIPYSPPPHM